MPEYIYEFGSPFPVAVITDEGNVEYCELSFGDPDVRSCIPRYYFEVPIS